MGTEIVNPLDSKVSILPSSMLRNPKGIVQMRMPHATLNMQPIFCANCGADGGYVPELPENCNFAFYICRKCEGNGELQTMLEGTGHFCEPDTIFWEKLKQAQLEEDGRELEGWEVAEALKDSTHYISKLATERDSYLQRSRNV